MVWIYDDLLVRDDDLRFYGKFSPEFDKLAFNFCKGDKLTAPQNIPPIELIIPDKQNGDIHDNISVPPSYGMLVGSKLKKVFNDFGVENIDWYQVTIRSNSKIVSEDYYLGNILTAINGVDFKRSELELDEDDNRIVFIDKLVIRDDIEPGSMPDIFRLKEFLPLRVVSDRLKNAMVESGCTGIEYLLPEEVTL